MINFKEIEITGFKSFADTTKISFDGGITGIVGPNGCGKSNVSDAIRWVFGEQSSKALRGKSMQDVIFAGTEKRKKLSYCEVSLVFDNTQKWFNIDYDEVVLTRKLYRSGESEYQLNRKPCRLKDIRDILYDSGMGRDGYSLIGQGRVEEIIQSKPEERRAIFEEAAGIAKYKARKTETESRLERVRENLNRLNDILSEVERRLGPLKKQSEDAKKYLELRDVLKQQEINAYIYQYDHASQTKQEISDKLAGYRDNLNVYMNNMETEQAKYDKSLNEINQIDKRANDLHEQVLNLTVNLEKKQGDSRLLDEQSKYLREQIDRLKAQLDVYTLDRAQKQALVNAGEQAKVEEQENLKTLNAKSQTLTTEYMALVDELTKTEGEKEASQRNLINNFEKLTEIKTNLSAYIAKRDTMAETVNADKSKLMNAEQNKNDLDAEIASLSRTVDDLKREKDNQSKSLEELKQKSNDILLAIDEINGNIFALKSGISNDNNRMNILKNLQADFEGYQFAVKRLLQDGKNNAKLSNAIKGVVGNLISVDSKYSTAIEIALGSSIQNIVTKNEDDAKVLINYLKDSRLGRATFLPMNAVKPRFLNQNDKNFLSVVGCFGVASDLVKIDAEYKRVIDSLLGSTVVCDNLDNAVNLARKSNYAFKIVTLEGDVLSPQGSMSGGSKKSNDSSLLNKDNEINALKQNIEVKSKELNELEIKFKELTDTNENLKSKIADATSKLQAVDSDYYTNSSKLESIKVNADTLAEEIFSLKSQVTVADNILKDLENKINSIDQVELGYSTSQVMTTDIEDKNQDAYLEMRKKREEYSEQMTDVKVNIASAEQKIRSLDATLYGYKQEIENLDANIQKIQAELNSQQRVFDEVSNLNNSGVDDSEIEKLKAELQDLNTKLSQMDDFKQSLMKELKDTDDRKTNLTNEISRLNNKIYQEETKLQKVDIDIENMQERIYEEYEMTYNDCLKLKTIDDSFDIKETMIQIGKIKNSMTALGTINLNAIEEYKSEGTRYEEMLAQIEDLKQAEQDAEKIIKDLSVEMLEKFNTEFAKIQENFTKVFKELFGGGNARLELLPSDDPLTAGVEIIAQPPGKVLANTTLLSGGEKTMTAIAILFAILKLKPMPFCFLDEIEAALDDSNIDRYANYLKRFSDETQFIVITHRKPTMEVVDALYGVTMEEKGVSKIVSVKLDDAVKAVNAK